jgi:hypothetical protein
VGDRRSGQVRWIQAQGTYPHIRYRDKYIKFSYSSHFPFCLLKDEQNCPWDATLVFRNPATGHTTARQGITDGRLTADGVRIAWWTELDGRRIEVVSEIDIAGEFERRRHQVKGADGLEALEGSAALGLRSGEAFTADRGQLRNPSGHAIASWNLAGFDAVERTEEFHGRRDGNVIYPRAAILTMRAKWIPATLASLHYASPKPLAAAELEAAAKKLA